MSSDDRDTPRPGRPADLPDSSEDDTLDRTPPPTCVPPEPTQGAKRRRAEVSTSPDLPPAVKRAIEDLWHELEKHREAYTEVQRALDRLWGLRDAHDLAIANATTNAQLKAAVDALAIHGPGADDAAEALALVRELRVELTGRDGTNGRFGRLAADLQDDVGAIRTDVAASAKASASGERKVKWFFGAALGALAGAAALIIATALKDSHAAGSLETQVENNQQRIDRLERQIDRLPGPLFLPARSPATGDPPP